MGDRLITALCADAMVRIVAISGVELVAEARRIHKLSRVGTAALGRQLLMTAIMAADLKNETDRVSTIVKGGGPGGNLVCTGNPELEVKGTVAHPEVELPPKMNGKLDVSGFVGADGQVTVVRDLSLKEPYVGTCNLVSGEIAEDFAQYYLTSQQQPSIVYLGVREWAESGTLRAAGGMLVQPMPFCPDETVDLLQARAERITSLSKQLDEGTSLNEILMELFGDLDLVIMAERRPRYHCDCSRHRIEQALISVGAEELKDMIEHDHGAEVQCHFCNRTYRFSEAQLTALLWASIPKKET
ncbi:MAG: Hsp33 family molecular chaperone HslO [Clostridia bacterium]